MELLEIRIHHSLYLIAVSQCLTWQVWTSEVGKIDTGCGGPTQTPGISGTQRGPQIYLTLVIIFFILSFIVLSF